MKIERRTNAGYEIISSVKLHEIEYVLGVKGCKSNVKKYATWMYNAGGYHHGHYIDKFETALKDMYERAKDELERRIDILDKPF